VAQTQACPEHQEEWKKHLQKYNRHTFVGIRRVLRRPNENLPWSPPITENVQPHDGPAPEPGTERPRNNYFTAPRFYCIETVCTPCGVVIAWAKFAKSESPTNILAFLEQVFPTEESRPAYICIDKACVLLRTSIANGSWDAVWKKTTRFIVDSYHYINHRTTDYLCWKWCSPAPGNGSAPNLVVVDQDEQGNQHYKRAFNTQVSFWLTLVRIYNDIWQACEQLNAWLGGYELILKRMTQGNFDWFLHTMLFYHTGKVLDKQAKKASKSTNDNGSDDDDDEEDM
jgi:hypothetical protein